MIASIYVRFSDGGSAEYGVTADGMIYNIGEYRQLKSPVSLDEFAALLIAAGHTVELFNEEATRKREERRREAIRTKPDYELGYGVPWSNAEYRRAARRSLLANRAMKKR